MKKFILLCFVSVIILSTQRAQKNKFEGRVTYDIAYLELPEEMDGLESMLPKTMEMKSDWMRIEQEVMGGSQIVIVDLAKKESHVLMDMMGQKIAISIPTDSTNTAEENSNEPGFELVDEYKKILGYKCQKAIVNAESGVSELWFTKKIKARHQSFKDLPGFPLEYVSFENNIKLRMIASEISKSKVGQEQFQVPEDYEVMTEAELTKMMGGN